jgi:hypothetical protein
VRAGKKCSHSHTRASASTQAIGWLLAGCEEEGDTSASDDHIVLALSGQVSDWLVVVAGLAVAGDACICTASSVQRKCIPVAHTEVSKPFPVISCVMVLSAASFRSHVLTSAAAARPAGDGGGV